MYSLAEIQPLLTSKLKAVGTCRKQTSWTNLGVRTSIKNQIIIISESYFQTRQSKKIPTILSLLPTQRGIEPRSKCFEHYHTSGAHIHAQNLSRLYLKLCCFPHASFLDLFTGPSPCDIATFIPPRHEICKNYIREASQRYTYRKQDSYGGG